MNDIIEIKDYSQYKMMLDTELRSNAESFIRIGYLLKVARDTNVLTDSGYKSVAEFAQSEYGLSKDIVSRYIAINDRYAEGGYSDRLSIQYEGYGVAKLAEMLTLSDEVIAEIGPQLTRKEIQEIKKEIAEEEKITPLEVALEAAAAPTEEDLTLMQRIWKEAIYDIPDARKKLDDVIKTGTARTFMDAMAPSGMATLWARIPRQGKYMIVIKGKDQPITVMNVRDNSKIEAFAEEAAFDISSIFGGDSSEECWNRIYSDKLPVIEGKVSEISEVAPVQQPEPIVPKEERKPEEPEKDFMPEPAQETFNNAKESHDNVKPEFNNVKPEIDNVKHEFDNTEPAKEIEAAVVEPEPEEAAAEQLPGQTEIDDFPEYLPKVEAEVVEEEPLESEDEEDEDEDEILEDTLMTLMKIRRILADAIGDKLKDQYIANVKDDANEIIRQMKRIEKRRKDDISEGT